MAADVKIGVRERELKTFDNNNTKKAEAPNVNGRNWTCEKTTTGVVFLIVAAILFSVTATLGAGVLGGGNMYYISAASGLVGIFFLLGGVKKTCGHTKGSLSLVSIKDQEADQDFSATRDGL